MPSTATPREEPSTFTRLLRGAKRGARNVYDGATAQYFRPQEFAQDMSDAMVAAPDAIINALRSPRETIRAGLEATKDAFATPERTGATLVGAIPSLINALRGRGGAKKDIIISGEDIPRAQKLKLPVSDYWVDENGIPRAWLSERDTKLKTQVVPLHTGAGNVRVIGDDGNGPRDLPKDKGDSFTYSVEDPLMNGEVRELLRGPWMSNRVTTREFQDHIDHPHLFALRPDMRHIPVRITEQSTYGGEYNPHSDTINLDLGAYSRFRDPEDLIPEFHGRRPAAYRGAYSAFFDPKSTLQHEGQHAYDGFHRADLPREYRGASTRNFPPGPLQFIEYLRNHGEVGARFTGGGYTRYHENELMGGAVPKILENHRESYNEIIRRQKELDLLSAPQKSYLDSLIDESIKGK